VAAESRLLLLRRCLTADSSKVRLLERRVGRNESFGPASSAGGFCSGPRRGRVLVPGRALAGADGEVSLLGFFLLFF